MATMIPFPTPSYNKTIGYGGISVKGPFAGISVAGAIFDDPTPPKRRHSADPIKDPDDLNRISEHLVATGRYRDNLLFVAGINFGLRCGDLVRLKIGHLVYWDKEREQLFPNRSFTIIEEKTERRRTLYINEAVAKATALYIQQLASKNARHEVDLNNYLFRSQSNRSTSDQPMAVRSVERLLKEIINEELGIDVHASTHCLRKTFGYHMAMSAPDRSRAVSFLQHIFGHSTSTYTLLYIGITDEEIEASYNRLNLAQAGMDLQLSSGYNQKFVG